MLSDWLDLKEEIVRAFMQRRESASAPSRASLPLVFGDTVIALLWSVLNALLLTWRISYRECCPRFIPGSSQSRLAQKGVPMSIRNTKSTAKIIAVLLMVFVVSGCGMGGPAHGP